MAEQVPLSKAARADDPAYDKARNDETHEVAPDVAYQRLALVNVAYVGVPGSNEWVLIDTGVPGTARFIKAAAAARFGKESRPAAIVITHGHFDHVGALETLAREWDVPVYAHIHELPYLDGRAAYPPPDPSVGGGIMSTLSPLFPRGPVDVSPWLRELPLDGTVPGMPGWKWVATPGHTPGHVSLWRASDRMLIAGDAFITTRQESAYGAWTQAPEMHGPPMYFTQDWEASRRSVEALAALEPEVAVTGHGRAMRGEELRAALATLARDFDRVAVPEHGRYVAEPARVETRTAYEPTRNR
jgi:Zn-dependent hydrolases, including glyoxylases